MQSVEPFEIPKAKQASLWIGSKPSCRLTNHKEIEWPCRSKPKQNPNSISESIPKRPPRPKEPFLPSSPECRSFKERRPKTFYGVMQFLDQKIQRMYLFLIGFSQSAKNLESAPKCILFISRPTFGTHLLPKASFIIPLLRIASMDPTSPSRLTLLDGSMRRK